MNQESALAEQDGRGPRKVIRPPRGGVWFGDYSLRDFAAKIMVQLDDLAELDRYRILNRTERAGKDDRRRVVLMGDSITEFWTLDDSADVRWINRGVAGQNSSMMLLRFQADVVELQPDAVVILAGTNDLRAYVGDPEDLVPEALERLGRNLAAMANMAEGRGIRVVLSTLPPVGDDLAVVARSPVAVREVNVWIAAFARERGYPLADYHAALSGPDGLMPSELSEDGVHPNAAGYARMASVLRTATGALTSLLVTDTRS